MQKSANINLSDDLIINFTNFKKENRNFKEAIKQQLQLLLEEIDYWERLYFAIPEENNIEYNLNNHFLKITGDKKTIDGIINENCAFSDKSTSSSELDSVSNSDSELSTCSDNSDDELSSVDLNDVENEFSYREIYSDSDSDAVLSPLPDDKD